MSKLLDAFKLISKSFDITKEVKFEDLNLSFVLGPLTTMEEVKILEACKDFESGSYIEALKRHSLAYSIKKINDNDLSERDLEYIDDQGKSIVISKYLFMLGQMEDWPAALRDYLFDVFNNLQEEVEDKISKQAKFERFLIQPPVTEESEQEDLPGFTRISESEDAGSPEEPVEFEE